MRVADEEGNGGGGGGVLGGGLFGIEEGKRTEGCGMQWSPWALNDALGGFETAGSLAYASPVACLI
jgi:hypothetical protein